MIRRNLAKRLERLEERILPPRDIHLLRVVYSNADGPAVGGYTVGPGYGSGRHSLGGRKPPNTLHFLSFHTLPSGQSKAQTECRISIEEEFT